MAAGNGLLVNDRNHDGIIPAAEMYGTGTLAANGTRAGTRAGNCYAALALEDSNGDGRIGAGDAHWKELPVWVDVNHDGKVDKGELLTLDSLGIVSLGLHDKAAAKVDHGNVIGLVAS